MTWDDRSEIEKHQDAEASVASHRLQLDKLTTENERLRADRDLQQQAGLVHMRDALAAESRLATAVGYVKKIYPNMWECDEALRRILAYNLAEPEAPKTAEPTFVCAPGESGYCDGCHICQPAAPTRAEAEQAVLDAMAQCPEATLRAYPEIAVCLAELARRGLR